ncbi:hypothetical protein QAD02_021405 [Eretmocerus hayati]|uniref:Uncharacterized protein n=1 Tax=Eretmocerus hayati TaxID=131215 RepID=A0ACC2PQD2_9HYME|nr:hypothetical protein QAD02_021405 [Eretmocerus hayati]
MSIYYQNVRGIRSKLSASTTNIHLLTTPPDIIVFTETWLHPDVSDGEIGLDSFSLFRNDRFCIHNDACRGGGVLIGIKKDIAASRCTVNITSCEQVFVKIKTPKKSIIIGAAYIPPRSPLAMYQDFLLTTSDL